MDQINTIERERNVNSYSIFTPLFDLPDSSGYFSFLSQFFLRRFLSLPSRDLKFYIESGNTVELGSVLDEGKG